MGGGAANGAPASDAGDDEGTPSPKPGNASDAAAAAGGDPQGFDGRAKVWLDANTKDLDESERAKWAAKVAGLRASVARQALEVEFKERDNFYNTNLKETSQRLLSGVDQNPAAFKAYQKQGEELIDASGLSAADKAAQKLAWRSNVALVYSLSQAKANPGAVAGALGSTQAGYLAKLRQAESGGNPNAQAGSSSAGGLYQITDGTWSQIVNSPEGKAAGLTAGGKMDAAQNTKGAAILTAQNARVLQQNGVDTSEANLRMAHFLGAQGAVNFVKAMQANPGAPAAAAFAKEAAANPSVFFTNGQNGGTARSLAEVYALQTKGFSGAKPDLQIPQVVNNLGYEDRQKVLGFAERQYQQQAAAALAATQQQHTDFLNNFQIGLHDGSLGAQDIANARRNGQLTDYDEIVKAESIVAAREKGVGDLQRFGAMLDSGTKFNPFDKDHKDAAEAGVEAFGGGVEGGLKVWQRTGVAAPSLTTALRGALASNDPAQVGKAAGVVSNMLSQNPNALAGAEGQSSLEKAATTFDHLVNGLGLTADEAGRRINQMNSPEYQASVKIREPEIKAFQDELRKGDPAGEVAKAFAPHWFGIGAPQAGLGADQRQAIGLDYAELATEHFEQYGDKDQAKAYALKKMQSLYGVSNGVLMKYPPERSYPPAGSDGHAYVYRQAAEEAKAATGDEVDPKKVYLMPLPTVTAEAFKSGQPTPYAIHYVADVDGVPMHKVVLSPNGGSPRPWIADAGKAVAEATAKDKADFEKARQEGATPWLVLGKDTYVGPWIGRNSPLRNLTRGEQKQMIGAQVDRVLAERNGAK